MEVSFRKVTLDDVEKVIQLCNICFFENTNIEYAKSIFEKTMNDSNQIYIMGTVGDEVIAHSKLTIVPTMYEDMNTYGIINHFCVRDDYRRHNVGTHMLEEITRICKEMECKSIKLWSNNYRIPAHACYLKYGFLLNEAGFFSKNI